MKLLNKIQQELKAPKGQMNSFGNYRYRSCEDILEAVKPLLGEAILLISDEIVMLGDRYYVKATASLQNEKEKVEVSAFARESLDKKGMDSAQITGATSSYARKYALNGLFCIDDTKDADTDENHKQINAHNAQTVNYGSKTITQAQKTPVKGNKEATMKDTVALLLQDLAFNPLLTKDDYLRECEELTQLELKEENYQEIIARLEVLKQEKNGN